MHVLFEFCRNLFYSMLVVYGVVTIGYLSYLGFIFLALIGGHPFVVLFILAIVIAIVWTGNYLMNNEEDDNEDYWRR